jgi:hypothetical protein
LDCQPVTNARRFRSCGLNANKSRVMRECNIRTIISLKGFAGIQQVNEFTSRESVTNFDQRAALLFVYITAIHNCDICGGCIFQALRP